MWKHGGIKKGSDTWSILCKSAKWEDMKIFAQQDSDDRFIKYYPIAIILLQIVWFAYEQDKYACFQKTI